MKLQAKAGGQFAALDDGSSGEGLAIFFSQSATDTTRWRLDVSARLNNGADKLVGICYVSPPIATRPPGPLTGEEAPPLTRQVAAAVCPGAVSWSVLCRAVPSPLEPYASPTESADIELISSKCCTAPVGLSRVGERYGYASNSSPGGTQNISLLPGQTVTDIRVIGLASGGQLTINGGDVIAVPSGVSINLAPMAPIPAYAVLAFTNVNWLFEYKESA